MAALLLPRRAGGLGKSSTTASGSIYRSDETKHIIIIIENMYTWERETGWVERQLIVRDMEANGETVRLSGGKNLYHRLVDGVVEHKTASWSHFSILYVRHMGSLILHIYTIPPNYIAYYIKSMVILRTTRGVSIIYLYRIPQK